MFTWVLLGIALMVAVALLARWFATASPTKMAQWIKWSIVGVGFAAAIFLGVTGRIGLAMIPLAIAVLPSALGAYMASRGMAGPSPGKRSHVETAYLRMELDHDSGDMTGVVLSGAHAGRALDDLSEDELLELLEQCAAHDPQGERVLESYLDRRLGADWRQRYHEDDESGPEAGAQPGRGWGKKSAKAAGARMTRDEALEILGLEPDASPSDIKEAHRNLMQKMHPDRGGSDYLAAKINQAKDVLLGL